MPTKRSTPKVLHRAWELRQQTTETEAKLWTYLRELKSQGIHFRRQHAIGPYVADFCAPRQHLVIELDGSPHLEQEERDVERTAYLKMHRYRVMRFWNNQVMKDLQGVMSKIEMVLKNQGE